MKMSSIIIKSHVYLSIRYFPTDETPIQNGSAHRNVLLYALKHVLQNQKKSIISMF